MNLHPTTRPCLGAGLQPAAILPDEEIDRLNDGAGMVQRHIRSYTNSEIDDPFGVTDDTCSAYIRWLIYALDLRGVVRLLESDYDGGPEYPY